MFNKFVEQMAQIDFERFEQNGYKKDAEGFYICPKCKTRASRLTNDGSNMHVPTLCECAKAKKTLEEENERKFKIAERRRECFISADLFSHTFENDNGNNPKLSSAMKEYVKRFEQFRKDGAGFLLFGEPDHGKTYIAHCVANALIDNGYRVKQTCFSRLKSEAINNDRFEMIDSYMRKYDLIILDDLGVERLTDFMYELVFNVIDTAYTTNTPLIITSNYTEEEIKNPTTTEAKRLMGRIREKCHPIKVINPKGSQRNINFANNYLRTKEILGL